MKVVLVCLFGVVAASSAVAGFVWHNTGVMDEIVVDVPAMLRTVQWFMAFSFLHLAARSTPWTPMPSPEESRKGPSFTSWTVKFCNRACAFVHAAVCTVWALYSLHTLFLDRRDARSNALLPYTLAKNPDDDFLLFGVVEFTLGYAVYDFIYMMMREQDTLFMLHHLAMFLCFIPTLFFPSGFVIIVVGIAIAEITNPLLLPWMWSKDNAKRKDIPREDRAKHKARYQWLSGPLTLSYVIARGIVMPLSLLDVARALFWEGHMTPVTVWIWFYCCAGFLGSLLWIKSLVSGYLRMAFRKMPTEGSSPTSAKERTRKKAD
uniref:TLC domain-containing protein n=1 Tax=Rhizochromulina marina TaxID=1034831 RepID=A0A7S2WW26_9STRA|mmetsp:Transcript_7227/g.20853  ORF Transcript_7227/g.20853 Transcript_7227/m.20853 type:complete len:319 (+) Transcript_7227:24-980(+)